MTGGVAFGVNVFAGSSHGAGAAGVSGYALTLRGEADRAGTQLGEPGWDDDHYAEKLDLLCAEGVPVVSFTFGCPSAADVRRLHGAGCAVWVTVTTPAEAIAAGAVGADALVVQGVEAGGHRGSFDDGAPGDVGLLALLQLVRSAVGDEVPLVATGGIATGHGIAAVLAAGAVAAQLGTAFMLCPEAATPNAQRAAIAQGSAATALTRAFTGRTARGIVNRFQREHSADAPSAYPEVHHLTAPIRAAARRHDDADGFNLWAGQAYPLSRSLPAAELVAGLAAEAEDALTAARARLSEPARFGARPDEAGDPRSGGTAYQVRPIGWVESALVNRADAPNQGDQGAPAAWLVINPDVREGIRDLRVGSDILVLTWLHQSRRDELATQPGDDPTGPERGVFSTRSPARPNPVGLHRTTIIAIEDGRLRVQPLEAINETPLVDIKPVIAAVRTVSGRAGPQIRRRPKPIRDLESAAGAGGARECSRTRPSGHRG